MPDTHRSDLESLPAEWPILPIESLGEVVGGSTPSRGTPRFWGGVINWVTPGELTNLAGKYLETTREKITSEGLASCGACLLPPESLLVTSRATLGSVAITRQSTSTNQGFKSIVFSNGCPHFYYHLFGMLGRELRRRASGTTFLEISAREFRRIELPAPPMPEQRQIAEILDTVDDAIRKTEEIIAKLKQVKQGLLHGLLTRGIDDNGELRDPDRHPEQFKDSPLGRVPKAWTVTELRQLATLVTSGSRGWAAFYADEGPLFVRSQNIRMGYLDFSDRQHVAVPAGSEGQRTKLEVNDLLVTITGNSVGNVALVRAQWKEGAFVSQHVGLVRLAEPALGELAMLYLLRGAPGNQQIIDAQYGQSKPGLNLENLRSFIIPVPQPRERKRIVARLSLLLDRVRYEDAYLAKLSALKQGLMEDLLTGRVRVTPLLKDSAQ